MIRIWNGEIYKYLECHDISQPMAIYANRPSIMELSPEEMRKTQYIYVGDDLVYGERQYFKYTLKYKSRIGFSFHGVTLGLFGNRYCEATSEGYIEDIVRLDTYFPTYIGNQPLGDNEAYGPLIPSDPHYGEEPWGRKEIYLCNGTEHLITPPIALRGVVPGSPSSEGGRRYVYQEYTDRDLSEIPIIWRYILQRTVHSDIVNETMRNWDAEPSVTIDYTIQALKYNSQDQNEGLYNGYYVNTSNVRYAFPIGGSLSLGLICRYDGDLGQEGLYLISSLAHYPGSAPNGVWYAKTPLWYGATPGRGFAKPQSYGLNAPMFSGHKSIECYNTSYDTRREITDWGEASEFSRVNLDGTFEIIENNNPTFGSISDYVNYRG